MADNNLHVPNSRPGNSSTKSIMDAYNSQSKVELYDESSSLSNDEMTGVQAKNIPMSALRPKQPVGEDEQGRPVYSKSQYAEDIERRADIRKAYMKMNGMDEESESDKRTYEELRDYAPLRDVQEAEIEYIEDVPDDNEGLLHYLETCITNAEANLEMLKSLYAALQS